VIDPFGDNPVIMTGSHNLGFKASSKNDDNLVIIEGNAPLAAAYAVNIIATFQTYRWNSYVEAHRKDPRCWHGLEDDDQWQNGYLSGDSLAEIKFWLGETAEQAVGAPVGAGSTITRVAPAQAPPHRHRVHAVSTRHGHNHPARAAADRHRNHRINGGQKRKRKHPRAA